MFFANPIAAAIAITIYLNTPLSPVLGLFEFISLSISCTNSSLSIELLFSGFDVSIEIAVTVTILSSIVSFPTASVTLYVNLYSPGVSRFKSLNPSTVIFVKLIPKISSAVTLSNSLNVSPTLITTSPVPIIVGAPYTFITLSSIASFPAASVTLLCQHYLHFQ